MAFNHIPVAFEQPTQVIGRGGRRYRTPGGLVYPSVTTVLQKTMPHEKRQGLQDWRDGEAAADYIMQESAIVGTQTHKLIENHLNGVRQTGDVRLLSVAHFNNLIPFLQKISDIYGVEIGLYSDAMRIAGTADCIAKYDGRLSVIDYKTKRSDQQEEWLTDHFIQATAYSQMFEELSGIPVGQVVILVSSEKNTRAEFVRDTEDYKGLLADRLGLFYGSGRF